MRWSFVLTIILFANITNINAQDLLKLYQLAKNNDPILNQAREAKLVALEALPQAKAKLFPVFTATSTITANHSSNKLFKKYNTNAYGIILSQPIFNFVNWIEYKQADDKILSAIAMLVDAEQDMIIRLVERYFSVLAAKDDLNFAIAKRKAFGKYLEQAKERFRVGLIAITDANEAQARYDIASAQEIAAENFLSDQKELLSEMIGDSVVNLANLHKEIKLLSPVPDNIDHWINIALKQNFKLQSAHHLQAAAKKTVSMQQASHLPTLQLNGSFLRSKSTPPDASKDFLRSVGVSLTMPIWSGGAITSKTRQAVHAFKLSSQETEEQKRKVESSVKQFYRGILTKISQIKALKQAVISNNSALESIIAAFNVGTRTIVDVLNAQSELLNARKSLHEAYYNYILVSVNLKKSAGILSETDIYEINKLLD